MFEKMFFADDDEDDSAESAPLLISDSDAAKHDPVQPSRNVNRRQSVSRDSDDDSDDGLMIDTADHDRDSIHVGLSFDFSLERCEAKRIRSIVVLILHGIKPIFSRL